LPRRHLFRRGLRGRRWRPPHRVGPGWKTGEPRAAVQQRGGPCDRRDEPASRRRADRAAAGPLGSEHRAPRAARVMNPQSLRRQPPRDEIRSNYPRPCLIFALGAWRQAAASLPAMGQHYGVRFIAAVKALPAMSLLEGAAQTGGGFDVANVEELDRLAEWWR